MLVIIKFELLCPTLDGIEFNKEQSREKIDKIVKNKKFYFSHSFADKVTKDINCPSFNYGENIYRSIFKYRNLIASQFHPELSGKAGQEIFNLFLNKNL